MKHLTLLTAAAALAASTALAGNDQPFGAHFIAQWDDDGDGQVTLAEAQERRDDIFTMFDANEDDVLDAGEYEVFDTHRLEESQMIREQAGLGQGMGQGNGIGQGRGNGMGQREPGFMRVHAALQREFSDADGNGEVTRDEFVAVTPVWFERMDRSGDGVLTSDDFGPGRG